MAGKGANLRSQITRAMIGLTLTAFAVVYFGMMAYFFVIYEWLYPDATADESWRLGDTVMVGLVLGFGLLSAALIGWRLGRRILAPLETVAVAARQIASGDFSARAGLPRGSFGEAGDLVADFNRMAERLQQAEAELAYSNSAIAHELRTPLTILRGRLQGLLDGVFAPGPQLYARLIAHVDDLSAIVEELRTLALGTAGQLDLICAPVDLAAEAEAALDALDAELAGAGLVVTRRLAPAVTRADRARLRQAFVAVLENACRYAPQAGLLVETGVAGETVYFRCTDSGPGLSPEGRARAFERFWRAEASRGRSLGGSGLGLPIVRAIARAHGGEALILPDSPGLTVEIRLPCRKVSLSEQDFDDQ
ncbi:ATP-binding protein [Rhodobacter capsulatus]|jgi:two-component system sensor histidine kinase AdeS|uniref:histidine kinase n=1 Tax=Rhodobacter capsulatus (strain ATCC BAA-309 / NBRC 16581 / SB1003) TaxID=272942 RepID=D5APQ7_RHOCB|nr:ATP-binding protein [Rhodobacter capsulatus]ADE86626.1 sensor histidine kinase [Rhodobacter capsulatus SB 1003]ETD00610.1 histidine kinase [Rhodobacter capsulatus DE442]ETD78370.1 histidine kinase [Rhodobacter capsulatus R121]ETE54484.1 histidine kinase [Rhodobacter capsulatus Y262]MDS0928427.1 ATP-binding protein [Rhodobacter capsulatus]